MSLLRKDARLRRGYPSGNVEEWVERLRIKPRPATAFDDWWHYVARSPSRVSLGVAVELLVLPGRFPGLNDALDARAIMRPVKGRRGQRGAKVSLYDELKAAHQSDVGIRAIEQRIHARSTAHLDFFWAEPNSRRDPDNVTAIGRKIVLDALVKTGILPSDGWSHVLGFSDNWAVSSRAPFVAVAIHGPFRKAGSK